tara:strand:+ start:1548 stop:1973 length:426 start_codon:yes stop_codon:yes gene_type:complete
VKQFKKRIMRKLLLILGLGLVLTSCKKEENNSYNGISYEGDLFKVEQYNQSFFSYYSPVLKQSKDFSVVGGDVLEVSNDYMIVSIKDNQSIQLVVKQIICCSCGFSQYFKITNIDSDLNELSDGKIVRIRCETNSNSFTNE